MWLIYSLLSAVAFGLRGILYHWGSQKPVNRNLMLCGVFAVGALVSLVVSLALRTPWPLASLIGIQMGLFSFAANASMFKGFAVGKASLVAILTALPSVVVVILAYLLWDERLNGMQLIAFLIIVGGVLLVRYSNDLSFNNLQGAQWGILAMFLFAFNDLSGKWSTIAGAEMVPTMFFMFATGATCFALWWIRDLSSQRAREAVAPPVSQHSDHEATAWSAKKTFFVGMAIGTTNTAGMFFILSAFDLGKAGLVSAVTALNVLLLLLYTRFVVKEKFAKTEIIGMALSFGGMLLIRLFGE